MNSQLYDCRVFHSRSAPKPHAFSYRLFMFYIDLDEEQSISDSLRLVSNTGRAPYQLCKRDHYDAQRSSIKENIVSYLESKGIATETIGKIHLLTHLRTFGHVFNPVSFYFVDDVSGNQLCSIAEVDNTFNEQKLFLIKNYEKGAFTQNHRKQFYVSPFSDLETTFHFNLRKPTTSLRIGINQSEEPSEKAFFKSALVGKSVPLNDTQLATYTLRFPAITIGILAAIHWQALKLWLKGHRARKKNESPESQTGKHIYLKPHKHPTH
ncbi:DUF1365 domain-containing protein [Pelagicoccus mobilis]|uniref:DUF1365 domain-containing protein n=1 Tax=Pelagicoccus mobilis TaxID=415221 RepID=A0A934S3N7_9BACT|nr:DUF1365 domain-containing protein [Pelagicoccus mobilis]MBK1880096.1 DUF1365 domain-containing protein [Pelagicoccus mobilis]